MTGIAPAASLPTAALAALWVCLVLTFVARTGLAADPAAGAHLVERFECNRCHDGLANGPAPVASHCVHCHQKVRDGSMDAPADVLRHWRSRIVHLLQTPSLAGAKRFKAAWLAGFLRQPHDLRPGLAATMPRLPLSARQAADIAAWLGSERPAEVDLAGADLARGRRLFQRNGCGTCHRFGGAELGPAPATARRTAAAQTQVRALAPNLRHTRDRMASAAVVAWITSPKSVKADAAMPEFGLSARDARDLARFVLQTPLATVASRSPPRRLPLLRRRVRFQEVADRVLQVTCWHCHTEPDEDGANGGPGYSGGFGFRGMGVNLVDRAGVLSGAKDAKGGHHSIVRRGRDGMPRLVAVLMARHAEVAGRPVAGIRGMPLGLPPLPLEDIQLVETWVRQGARP